MRKQRNCWKKPQEFSRQKSVVIKESIKEYCTPLVKGKRRSPYELVQDLIEKCPGSGRGDLAARAEEILRERSGEKP